MVVLVVEFAAKKPDMMRTQDKILTKIQCRGIIVDESSLQVPAQLIGLFGSIAEGGLFRYRWRLTLLSSEQKLDLEALKKDLRDEEVYDIFLES